MGKYSFLLIFMLGVGMSTTASAQEWLEKTEVHIFAGWAYGDTDGNQYTQGADGGEYENVEFALAIDSTPHEKLKIFTQAFWEGDSLGGYDVELDYAFAEWAFKDQVKLRVGRVKQPFGLFTEVYDVGTIRPFFSLPQGIYGPSGITAKSYNGLGFTGEVFSDGGWGFQYDVYGGEIDLFQTRPWKAIVDPTFELETDDGSIKDFIGTRLSLVTPVHGIRFGLSAYTGRPNIAMSVPKHEAGGVHLEFLGEHFWLRSEYGIHQHGQAIDVDAAYLELAYKFRERWQVAARYDWLDSKINVSGIDLSLAPTLAEHRDIALGINYWFTPSFVMKFAVHQVEGNRFALPGDIPAALASTDLDEETSFIELGGQFSF